VALEAAPRHCEETRRAFSSIAGLIPVSMVDWEGKLAAVVFTRGCNLRCPYCHNPELVTGPAGPSISWSQVTEQLKEKTGWVDGVVLTGGEPTLSPDLFDIIEDLSQLGLPVKLDTNGTRPEVVERLIAGGLIRAAAVDIKAGFDNYDAVTGGIKGYADKIKQSAELLLAAGLDPEFRTTVVPGFVDHPDVLEVARFLAERGAGRYYLQQFNPKSVLDDGLNHVKPYPPAYLHNLAEACSKHLQTTVRGAS
jgi:pyruvate formate lyase activating enzyme